MNDLLSFSNNVFLAVMMCIVKDASFQLMTFEINAHYIFIYIYIYIYIYTLTLKYPQIQSERIYFSKISWETCPHTI